MIEFIQQWYRRHFSDPQVALLAVLLIAGFAVIFIAGDVLAPLLVAVVMAYVLDGAVEWLVGLGAPRVLAVIGVFLVFLGLLLGVTIWLLPLLIHQAAQFFSEVPQMANKGQTLLMQLPERYPEFVTRDDITSLIGQVRSGLGTFGQRVVSLSIRSVMNLLTILVYMVLVPVLIFFLLIDKQKIFDWASSFLPTDRALSLRVWREMNIKISSYMRGKMVEIVLVWLVTYITFSLLNLNYAMLLAVVVGLSVIIPYVGAAVATFPVALIAYFQWGFSMELLYVLVAYSVIQFFDGNLLVPLLFSEAVNLHPVAIIAAVLVFGGFWGVWGVFFAIPLATLIQSVINAWPKRPATETDVDKAAALSPQPGEETAESVKPS